MTWFYVDDGLAFHRKVVAAGNAAMGLWLRAGALSAQQLDDGVVLIATARSLGTRSQVAALLRVGLWHATGHDCKRCADPGPGAYVYHDYVDFQPLRDDVLERRAKRAAAGAKGGQKSGASRASKREASASASAQANDEAEPKQARSKNEPRPVPEPPVPSGREFSPPSLNSPAAGDLEKRRGAANAQPRGFDGHPRHEHHDLVRKTCVQWESDRKLPIDAAELIAWCYRLGDGDAVAGRRLVDRATTQELDSATSPVRALRARLRELAPRRRDDDVPPWVQEVS